MASEEAGKTWGCRQPWNQTRTDTYAESDHAGTVLWHLISHRLIQFETAVKHQTDTHLWLLKRSYANQKLPLKLVLSSRLYNHIFTPEWRCWSHKSAEHEYKTYPSYCLTRASTMSYVTDEENIHCRFHHWACGLPTCILVFKWWVKWLCQPLPHCNSNNNF